MGWMERLWLRIYDWGMLWPAVLGAELTKPDVSPCLEMGQGRCCISLAPRRYAGSMKNGNGDEGAPLWAWSVGRITTTINFGASSLQGLRQVSTIAQCLGWPTNHPPRPGSSARFATAQQHGKLSVHVCCARKLAVNSYSGIVGCVQGKN